MMLKGQLVVTKIFIKEKKNVTIQIQILILIQIQILAAMMNGPIINLKKLTINIMMMLKAVDQNVGREKEAAKVENFVTKERAVVKELVIGKMMTYMQDAGAIIIVAVKVDIVAIKSLTKIQKIQTIIIMTRKQETICIIDGTRLIIMKKKKMTKNLKEMISLLSAKSKIVFSNQTKILSRLKKLKIKLLKKMEQFLLQTKNLEIL